MGKRLSDTAGVAATSCAEGNSEYFSRSVRKIDNGFVTSVSSEKNGEYSHKEFFSKSENGRGPAASCETLSDAIKECNK